MWVFFMVNSNKMGKNITDSGIQLQNQVLHCGTFFKPRPQLFQTQYQSKQHQNALRYWAINFTNSYWIHNMAHMIHHSFFLHLYSPSKTCFAVMAASRPRRWPLPSISRTLRNGQMWDILMHGKSTSHFWNWAPCLMSQMGVHVVLSWSLNSKI